ncbi:hypothetical protein HDV57DRAFT_413027 [Trichoderma longibrachiatum]|uniref:RRM domain-containing protein n=1 Tax=Trichoderma longibrachiatum ATCC 18648 TaxID=983965 RepID=A0A2T4C2L3_TRILO|nr:hypothetical protein M440DRAFT_1422905 [Trichoderma longibrachiatum ATCC 18648]
MTDKLPPNLLALFAARPPLRWVEPSDHAPEKRRTAPIGGVAAFLPELQKYKETDVYEPTESWLEMRDRKKREKAEAAARLAIEGPKKFKPNEDPNIRGDAFKTLIVARLSYDADERDLEREFGRFGPIERIRIITDTHAHEKPNKKKKPHRGYAFVVFEREKDMRAALDACDGIRIKDRRIKVDVERGRTAKNWLPRRLGGGLGGRGYTRAMPIRPGGPGGFGGGGFRGGFKGGFEGGRGGRGGFRGGFGGGRGGFRSGGDFGPRGGDRNGFGAPNGAPSGPGLGRRDGGDRGFGGYESRGGGRSYDDRSGGHRDGGRYGDRDRGDRERDRGDRDRDRDGRRTGSNMEPIGRREGGYRDRDYDRPRDDDSRKRGYEGGGYEDPRKLRRY